MAGEIVKAEAICLAISPWSKTSHVVSWLTPAGRIVTVVKGALRSKSFFLGQYDLNYTCEILYYVRAHGEVHALRECSPRLFREQLRRDYRALALAGYLRRLASELAPAGPDAQPWFDWLQSALNRLEVNGASIDELLCAELEVLALAGLKPDFSSYDPARPWMEFSLASGTFSDSGEGRTVRISRSVAEFLLNPEKKPENDQIPLDAERVIGVFYKFHLDCAGDVRRIVLGMLLKSKEGK